MFREKSASRSAPTAPRRLVATVVLAMMCTALVLTQFEAGTASASGGNLVMVTGDGTTTSGDDPDLRTFFEGLGWTVSSIDDNASGAAFTSAASSNDLMYVTQTVGIAAGPAVQDLAIPLVVEQTSAWNSVMYSGSSTGSLTTATQINVVDNSIYPTELFPTGALTIAPANVTVSFWNSGSIPLPAGAQVLAERVGNSDNDHLITFDMGAEMFSSTPSPERRVLGGWGQANRSQWGSNLETLIEQSLDWAAGFEGGAVTVNSTGDSSDATPGDGLCDTGGTNSATADECTLRAAIQEVNADADLRRIRFALPDTEPGHSATTWTITPTSALPALTTELNIDGRSQPEWTSDPIIAIDGTSAGGTADGFAMSGDDVEVSGLSIHSFGDEAIDVTGSRAIVFSNWIGLDLTGAAAGQPTGISIRPTANATTIGGTSAGRGNVISANTTRAIFIDGPNTAISNNLIGVAADGTTARANGDGLEIRDDSTGTATGNTIAHNGDEGVQGGEGELALLGNSIHSNDSLGIDLDNDGVTENDGLDGDAGPNDLLNFPVITAADSTTVDFSLDVPSGDYLVEAFRNPSGNDVTGNGEGEVFLGSHQISHAGGGAQTFTGTYSGIADGGDITLTTTSCDTGACTSYSKTSEFSDVFTPTASSPTGNLVMVTDDGTTANGNDAAKRSLFEGWGWTVTALDDQASGAAFTAAAASNDVMFVSDTAIQVSTGTQALDIGVVHEAYQDWDDLLFAPSDQIGFNNGTTLDVVDNSHPITDGFALGTLTVQTVADDLNYWETDQLALPAGVDTLLEVTGSSVDDALLVADSGALLYSANTAANRRVWFPSDAADPANWTSDYETLLERTLLWSGGVLAPPNVVTVNSTGDGADSSPGDGICDTGGTNSEGADECTLRAAIGEANASAVVDEIHFDIPGSDPNESAGAWSITPATALPSVSDTVSIDATTQTGWASDPVIGLNGAAATGGSGLELGFGADGSEISGLAVFGFDGDGIVLGSSNHVVAGNWIGLDATGARDGNGNAGVYSWGGIDNRIGGTSANDANRIEANGSGLVLDTGAGSGTSIVGNSISGNTLLAIDLGNDGLTLNDGEDGDPGPNDLLNFPVITAPGSGTTTLDVDLDLPAANYRIELFVNPTEGAGTGGYGEGETLVHAETVNVLGAANDESFTLTGIPAWNGGDVVTATATVDLGGGTYGSTSEFSQAVTATAPCTDSDGDGLCDDEEDANTDADDDPATNPGPDTDGDLLPNYLDDDDDGDGIVTAAENPDPNSDGDPRDARDSDFDGQPDWLDDAVSAGSTPIVAEQKISASVGDLTGPLAGGNSFGVAVSSIGDIDGDGITDVVVGATGDSSGRGAVYVLFLDADGTVKAEQKISSSSGGLTGPLQNADLFGNDVSGIGDVDGDGIGDIVVGAFGDDDGGGSAGAVYVLFLNADGTVKAEQKISDNEGDYTANNAPEDRFGTGIAQLGDLDGDGIPDIAVAAPRDDDGGTDRGAVHILFLNTDGTVKAEQKISDTAGDFTGVLDDDDWFGLGLGSIGDLDGDGVTDIAVASRNDDDGGTNRGAVHILFLNTDGTVKAEQKISDTAGDFTAMLDNDDLFGSDVAGVGDLDADGVPDLIVGAEGDDDDGTDRGAVYLLTLNSDGTVTTHTKISSATGGLTGPLGNGDLFGNAAAGLGDLDGDGGTNLIVGAQSDDDGASGAGAVYILDLTPLTDSDGDGLWDQQEDANTDADDDPATNPGPDTDGDLLPNYLDDDDDGDLILTAAENADPNADGEPRDALDTDRDGQPDYLDVEAGPSRLPVADEQKISDTAGDFTGALDDGDAFGTAVAALGDLDGDGVNDAVVGTPFDDDEGTDRGAVTVLFLNDDGTVRAEQKISDTVGGLAATLDDDDQFGTSVATIGDLDGDGVNDIAVGAIDDDDGAARSGAVHVLFLNDDGTVRTEQKISATSGGLTGPLDANDEFGFAVAGIGDLDGDGTPDLAVGAHRDDDGGGQNRGAVYVLFLNPDGTVRAEQKISDTAGGLTVSFDDDDWFGSSLASPGDLDGDGVRDLVVGEFRDDDGGTNSGAIHVLFLNADGTVDDEQKIGATTGGFTGPIGSNTWFGSSVTGVGDLDGDGIHDLLVGASIDSSGGVFQGAAYLLALNADGTVKSEQRLSSSDGGLTGPIETGDGFGYAVASLGDLDGDGTLDIAVGAPSDDDGGGTDRGAVYLVGLSAFADTDGDGLWDHHEDANSDLDGDPTTTPGPDTDGDGNANYDDSDDDGDGIPTATEQGDPNRDGDPRDAVDSDRDGQPDYLDTATDPSSGLVVTESKISRLSGGLTGPIDTGDYFGASVASIGDIDGDGVNDIAVGATDDDDGGNAHGAVHILFLNADGTVKAEQKISDTEGGLNATFDNTDYFGNAVAGLGDIDGDGIGDIAVGVRLDDDGGNNRGAVYVLLLNANGTVKAEQKISDTEGGFNGPLSDNDQLGIRVAGLGDLDGDGTGDLAVGAYDDDGGADRGAVYVLFLNADGTVKAEQKISDSEGSFDGVLDDGDLFASVATLGDLDGDGVTDIAVGAYGDEDGGSGRGAIWVLFLNTDGTVKAEQKISDTEGGFDGVLDDSDSLGISVAGLGDLDGDGVVDLAVGADWDSDGGSSRGAVYVLFLNADGTVKAEQKISDTQGGFNGVLDNDDSFGTGIVNLGDLDSTGTPHLAVSTGFDDDGGNESGAVYILELASLPDTDGDGLFDAFEDANTDLDNDPSTTPGPDSDGDGLVDYLDDDDDDDDTPTASENADPNGDGSPNDARDTDGDGEPDYLDVEADPSTVPIVDEQKISDAVGGFLTPLDDFDQFGAAVSAIGDIDGDGIVDLAVQAASDDDNGSSSGAIYILFLNANGTVKAEQKIGPGSGGLTGPIDGGDFFGASVTGLGDVDGDGIGDIAAGALLDDDGGNGRGAVWVLFLNANGTVKAEQKISDTAGGFQATLDDLDRFGTGVAGLGDVNGDGTPDLAAGAIWDDDGGASGSNRGAVYVLFLNTDGSVKAEQKISETTGGLTATLYESGQFGGALAGLDDLDGDGIVDLAVGASDDDDGGTDRGAVHILFLNADGTVKDEQKISSTTGGLSALEDSGYFGAGLTRLGDVNGDATIDVAVGNSYVDDGGTDRGNFRVLLLNTDGTVGDEYEIGSLSGGFTGPLDDGDLFGISVAGLGDLDDDGGLNIAVGAALDDDGGDGRGAVYILDLTASDSTVTVNSSGDAGDASAGDGVCDTGGTNSEGDDECTLRAAIEETNATASIDTITFALPNSDPNHLYFQDDATADSLGTPVATVLADASIVDFDPDYPVNPFSWWSIEPATELPGISGSTTIDGTTQPGWQPNTTVDGSPVDMILPIRIVGPTSSETLYFTGTGGTLRGLNLASVDSSASMAGLYGSGGHTIEGSWLMLDEIGTGNSPGDIGAWLGTLAPGSTVGGPDPADLVLIGNGFGGTGLTAIDNDHTIQNVWIGVSVLGDTPLDGYNDLTVYVSGNDNVIGSPGAGVVAATTLNNLLILEGDRNVVQGSSFGVLPDGSLATENRRDTIEIVGNDNMFGGVNAGEGNVVVADDSNSFPAVAIEGGTGNSVLGSTILGGGELSIDLGADGLTLNDAGDTDTGDNDLLNFPVITSITPSGGDIDVDFDLDVDDAGTYRIEFFTNDATGAPPTRYGAGDAFLGTTSVVHAGAGSQSYTYTVTDPGDVYIAATTTEDLGGGDYGSTSEFSLARCAGDTDGDGLCDDEEDANTDADDDPATNPGPNTDGDLLPNYLDDDDDGDAIPTASENADPNGDGDPRDALDTDRDGQPDYLDIGAGPSTTPVADEQKVSDTAGGLAATLDDSDLFGESVASVGDVDGDGVADIAVGAYGDDDGGASQGAVYVLLLNADGTVKAEQKISDLEGGLTATLDDSDFFGESVAGVGDLDGDGVADIAVGADGDDDGGSSRGAVYVLFLNADGTVKAEQKISDTTGGLTTTLDDSDGFGESVAGVGDLDGDGVADIAVGANGDDDGGSSRGAVYVLFLNADGTVKAEQKISDTTGGLIATLDNVDFFGWSVASVGDLDGDGLADIAVGANGDDDGGSNRGAVYVLFLNTDGTVKAEQKISDTTGGLTTTLDNNDSFGYSVAGVGDLDGDGVADIAVGAQLDDDGGNNRGALHVLLLNADGTVKAEQKISSTQGGLTGPLDDNDTFGQSVAGLGDLDSDGTLNLVVGATGDDDGGSNRGAVYVLDLSAAIDTDGDGLWDFEEDANTDADDDPTTNPGPDTDGDLLPNYLDDDDDDDTILTSAENADPNADGDPRDALDSDRDGQPDWLDPDVAGSSSTPIADEQKISDTVGGLTTALSDFDWFGTSVAGIGDLDGDGINDLLVGAEGADDGGSSRGAAYVLFLAADGSVSAEHKIAEGSGDGLVFDDSDRFGSAVAPMGDLDGDGVGDVVVSSVRDDDGGNQRGAVYVLMLNDDGTVRATQKISDLAGGLSAALADSDNFGSGVASPGDLDGDGISDLVVGASGDDDGASGAGAVHVLFLNSDGTVRAEHKISAASGDLTSTLDSSDSFGEEVAALGDLDGDGVGDIAVSAPGDDDGAGTAGAVYVLRLNPDGTVKGEQKISATFGNFGATLDAGDEIGEGLAGLGDLDGDGIPDLAVGTQRDDDGGFDQGAVYLLTLTATGEVATTTKISATAGGLTGPLDDEDRFGISIAGLGDLDGDGTLNLAIGSSQDAGDGGINRGAVYILDLSPSPCVVDSDSDGLFDCFEDANTDLDGDPATNPGPDTDDDTVPNYVDDDDDGDSIGTLSENADPNADGNPRDALDTDRDGEPDFLDLPTIPSATPIAEEQKISATDGGLTAVIDINDLFGRAATPIGDIDGDGIVDLAVSTPYDDDGGTDRGAAHILFLNPDGTVRDEQKISDTAGGLTATLDDSEIFGWAAAGIGDIDGDGIGDLAVGAVLDDDGALNAGAVHILFLNADGTVRDEQKISATSGGFVGGLDASDFFGSALASPGDIDGDGVRDIVVGAYGDDDGGSGRGASYVLFLEPDGTVRNQQKISDLQGGLAALLANFDSFGSAVGAVGDVNGDGIPDIGVGATGDDDGGSNRGAVYVLLLNADGTVAGEQKISDLAGGFGATFDDADQFGAGIAGVGDLDGDGKLEVLVGATGDDDGGFGRGAVHVLSLNSNGTVADERKISSTRGGFTGPLPNGSSFGRAVGSVGDLDGDGTIGLVIGAQSDGTGAVYILDLQAAPLVVNSTGDAGDATPGDARCDTGGTNSEGAPECTLRAAIQEVNASASIVDITFSIPNSDPGESAGVWTIAPATALPAITATVTIDGSTQPGFVANTNASPLGLNGTQVLLIDGSATPTGSDGFWIQADDVEVRGFAIGGFQTLGGYGVQVDGDRATIAGSYIGTDITGSSALPSAYGIVVDADDALIGGVNPADRNLISANDNSGVLVTSGSDTQVLGNLIGTTASGGTSLTGFSDGVQTYAGSGLRIGSAAAGNVILGFSFAVETGHDDLIVENNLIGTNHDYSVTFGGSLALALGGDRSSVVGNVIGNWDDGVSSYGADASITGNSIGTDPTGTIDLGMTDFGISVESTGAIIGGDAPGDANTIAFNGGNGVQSDLATTPAILGNSIYANGGLGIDIDDDGVTNSIAFGVLDFPVITSATAADGSVTVEFTLDVPAGDYRIEAFTNPSGADATGYGEGEVFATATVITHLGTGAAPFALTYAGSAGDIVALTTTLQTAGPVYEVTSEFSLTSTVSASTVVLDQSTQRNDMVTAGGLDASTPGAGIAADGFDFAGGDERLTAPAFDPSPDAITLSGWVNATTLAGDAAVIAKTGAGGSIYELVIDGATGEAVARMLIGATTIEARGGTLGTSAWHQVTATFDGATVLLYVDGQQVDSVAAVGSLGNDRSTPVTIGNTSTRSAPLVGSIDQVTVSRAAFSAARIETEFNNLSDPTAMVTLGPPQTEAPGSFSASTATVRSGSHALSAPSSTSTTDPWATVTGLDEPGLVFESYWYLSDPANSSVAAGNNTGAVPTDQRETRADAAGFDLAGITGGTRTVDATSVTTVAPSTWTNVEIRTDETGTSAVFVDGVEVISPTAHATGTSSGSAGLRVGTLPNGQAWYVDDVRIRRYVSDEPTTSLSVLHRQ